MKGDSQPGVALFLDAYVDNFNRKILWAVYILHLFINLPLMKLKTVLIFFVVLIAMQSQAQVDSESDRPAAPATQSTEIFKKIKTWRLTDGYTLADTLLADTLLTGFQAHNQLLSHNPFAQHLGNLGSPSQSMVLSDLSNDQDFFFGNAYQFYQPQPNEWLFYNTTLPYTNLFYQTGGPKRRSEENIRILLTQNIRKNWNAGFNYNVLSCVGLYGSQTVENRLFRFFTSYNGNAYSAHAAVTLYKFDQQENGGVENDSSILYPENYKNIEFENIPVKLQNTKNYLNTQRYFLNQSLNIGRIQLADTTREVSTFPVGTVFHTLEVNASQRRFSIDDLPNENNTDQVNEYFSNIHIDSLQTRDSVRFTQMKNTIQLKFNEEANSLFKFGVRGFIENEMQRYQQPDEATYVMIKDVRTPQYQRVDTSFVNTAVGGQIFKNRGENFWWSAGVKTYVQGYKIGDSEINGKMNSLFAIGKDTAGVFAQGNIILRSPGYLFEKYYSNHFSWDNQFKKEKTITAKGGIRIPTRRFALTGEVRLLNDYFYWNSQALPAQASGVIQVMEVSLFEHFKWWRFNSLNKLSWQATSDATVLPLPTLSAYSSNYYEQLAFKVLRFQIGFDVRYFTKYHAPAYMPATSQFYVQNQTKIGDYPFVDAFINFHLKRARLGVKYDHVNDDMGAQNSFLVPGYPNNPRSFKFQVSWNFYD